VLTRLADLGLSAEQSDSILNFASSRHGSEGLKSHLLSFEVDSELYHEGVEELCQLLDQVPGAEDIELIWDGSITRGLNYYTGAIFETMLVGAESLGSICSGGRYDDLCGRFTKIKMPGVGISLGLTRLLSYLFQQEGFVDDSAQSPTEILLINMNVEQTMELKSIASEIRSRGKNVELSPVGKLKKLMNYANRKGISIVVIPNEDGTFEWKNMESGEQDKCDRVTLLQKI
jgi:histidyl-tRNA synthetase